MNGMEIPSIVVHKGEKEKKYQLYIEDYVISYLKYKTGSLEFAEIFFFGVREENKKQYIIYCAGTDKHDTLFEKYDLLEEVGCRLTQAGPFFFIRETPGVYEIKGYEIFYQKNEEMQNYLVAVKQSEQKTEQVERNIKSFERPKTNEAAAVFKEKAGGRTQGWISLQLCAIFIILVAIVITSTNSYDKMGQLNQAAKEVFFAMENQSAQYDLENAAGKEPESGSLQDGAVTVEETESGETRTEETENGETRAEETQNGETEAEGLQNGETEAEEMQDEEVKNEEAESAGIKTGEEDEKTTVTDLQDKDVADGKQEETTGDGTEALSRNVTRYYKVEKGDTLYKISMEIYGDTSKVEQICKLNQITDPDNIKYGQKIILP